MSNARKTHVQELRSCPVKATVAFPANNGVMQVQLSYPGLGWFHKLANYESSKTDVRYHSLSPYVDLPLSEPEVVSRKGTILSGPFPPRAQWRPPPNHLFTFGNLK